MSMTDQCAPAHTMYTMICCVVLTLHKLIVGMTAHCVHVVPTVSHMSMCTCTHTVISVAVISPNADQTVLEGFPLTLTCTDSRGIPPPTFQWEKDDALITGTTV